jgi:hypothetical protein
LSTSYQSAYPRFGHVALLCEGDVVGYEVSILRRWLDRNLGTKPLVDLWPCGTGAAIFGVSDAIGRSRPIVVIEDRDYRSIDEARTETATKQARRAERGLRILRWQTWRRNEIENYLVDPEIAAPCLASVFDCPADDVKALLDGLLPALAVHQAFQRGFYRTRQTWSETDPSLALPNNLALSPVWNDSTMQAVSPSFDVAFQRFQKNVSTWRNRLATPSGVGQILAEVRSSYEQWCNPALTDRFWLEDWSGKDVLQWLRITLAARFGWRDRLTGNRTKLVWAKLNRARRDEQDRPIEAELKPFLVRAFLEHLTALKSGELRDEWQAILAVFAAYRDQLSERSGWLPGLGE